MRTCFATLLFFISFQLFAQRTEPVLLTDMLKIKSVNNVMLSQDGLRAAFVLNTIEPDDSNKTDYKYVNQIYMVGTSGSDKPVQLTTGRESASQPAWSPDGQSLAFVRSVNSKPQIFLLSMNGGEAKQLTSYKYGAANPVWSPDGNSILFTSGISLQDFLKDSTLNASLSFPVWPMEKPGLTNKEVANAKKSKAGSEWQSC